MGDQRQRAEVWRPGVFLQEEIDYRGWSVEDLAARSNLDSLAIQNILAGESPMQVTHALRIGRALGTGPDVWLNLQASWDSWNQVRAQRQESAGGQP